MAKMQREDLPPVVIDTAFSERARLRARAELSAPGPAFALPEWANRALDIALVCCCVIQIGWATGAAATLFDRKLAASIQEASLRGRGVPGKSGRTELLTPKSWFLPRQGGKSEYGPELPGESSTAVDDS